MTGREWKRIEENELEENGKEWKRVNYRKGRWNNAEMECNEKGKGDRLAKRDEERK